MRRILSKVLLLVLTVCVATIANAQVNYYSLSGATDFANPASWTTDVTGAAGTAPAALTNADNFTILAGATMSLNADATVRQLTNKGSLSVAANTLYIERATNNQALFDNQTGSTLNLSGGAIKVKGSVNFSGNAAFIQSGGDLYIDGNSGTTGTGTNPSTPLLNITSTIAINCTGGSWTFPDPHGNTSTTTGVHECVYYNPTNSISALLPPTHTINFGDGVSTSAGGNSNGFRTNLWPGSGRLALGSVNFNGVTSATNRFSTHAWTPALTGNLTVTSGEGRFTTVYVGGDVSVSAGATLTVGTLYMVGTSNGSSTGNVMATIPQSITNNGTIKSAATAVANLQIGTLYIGNNSATGVTLNSPLNVGSLFWTNPNFGVDYQGYLNTTATNILKVVGSGGTGVTSSTLSTGTTSGSTGDNDAYVRGPMQMVLGTGFSSASNIAGFPVGANAFNPLSFTGISGAPTSATTIQVEAFDTNSGTAGTGVTPPPSKRWDVSVVSGSLPLGGMKVRVSDPSITANSLLTRSATATGAYDIAGGGSTFSAAPNGTTYTVASVVTTSNITSANLTASYSFGDNTNPPSCAALTVPVNAAQIYTSPTLTWTAGTGAASYDVFISTTSPAYDPLNPTNNLAANVTTTSYVYTLTAPGTFYWTAIAKNINGLATGCTERSFSTAAPSNCGTLSTPVNAAQVYGSPTLTWTAATGAASYDVYLSQTSPAYDVLNPANNLVANLTTTSYATTLTAGGSWYWAVVAKNITGVATGCTERNFNSIPPACPALGTPADLATNVPKNPSLTWAASTGAVSYDLYVSSTSPAYDALNPATNLVTNTTSLFYDYATNLTVPGTYYWTVVAKNVAGNSTTCVERSFTAADIYQYCKPTFNTFGCNDGDVIARVQLNTLDNNSGTGCPGGASGYSDYRSNPALTTTLNAGTTYQCKVWAGQYSETYAAWIDFDNNGQFDASERLGFTATAITGSGSVGVLGSSAQFPLSLPCNPTPGTYTMRIRCAFATAGSAISPCGPGNGTNVGYGEVEDYIVTVAPPPPCPQPGAPTQVVGSTPATTRTFDWTQGCTETEWEVFVQPAGGPTPTALTVPTDLSITAHPYTATVSYGSNLEYWVRAVCTSGSVYSDWTGPTTFTTPDLLPNCANLVSPMDMATSVSLNTNVDWTAPTGGGGTPTSYDVYFGQTLPGTPTTNVAATVFTYKPTITLDYLTTYTWQIIPKNATGSATGCPVYTFTTEPVQPPACPAISAPAAGATGVVKNPTLTWVSVQGAASYDLYFSATSPAYDPLSPATNLVGNFTTTSYTFPTNLLANTPYYWAVIAKNSAGNSSNCTEYSFTTGDIIAYCPPVYSAGCTDNDLIARVTLNTLDNNSGTQCTSGALGYVDYRNNPALTTTLNAGTSYNCQVYVGQWSEAFAVWIDYNDNGIFETPSERIGYTTTNPAGSGTAGVLGGSATFPITLSCAPPVGIHSMRVRCVFGQSGINIDPCASYTWGETEDYIVTVAPPPPCPVPAALTAPAATTTSATLAWTPGCTETEWDVHVTTVGGGAPTGAPSNPGVLTNPTLTVTGLTSTTQYDYYVRAVCGSPTTSAWVGPFTFSTLLDNDEPCGAINLTVGAPPVSVNTAYATVGANDPANACSANNNTVWYKFTPATSGDYKILTTFATPQTFSPWIFVGTMLTCNDAFSQVSVGCLGSATNNVNALVGGQEYYIFVDGNSGSFGPMTIAVQEIAPVVSAKVYLNNIDLTTGLLTNYFNDPANSFPNFPTTDPYSVSGAFNGSYVHVNNPTPQTTTAAVLNATPTTGNAIVDWVFLELRNGVSGSTTVVATKAALLQRDGDIVDTDGVSPVTFNNAPSGDYYVAVRHRNHLGFRTDAKVTVTATTPTLDFATNQVQLYGATPNVVLNPSVATMVGADANSDGSIDAFDTILWEQQNGLFDDYTNNADYNMDGSVDALDSIIWELHNGKFEDLF